VRYLRKKEADKDLEDPIGKVKAGGKAIRNKVRDAAEYLDGAYRKEKLKQDVGG
jgi:hypothetical protein